MNLESVAEKLTVMAGRMVAERGPLTFLGLLLREDSPGWWDVVLAAPWAASRDREAFAFVARGLRETLSEVELAELSRIVILDPMSAVLQSFLDRFRGRSGLVNEAMFVAEGGATIRTAYLILPVPGADAEDPTSPQRGRRTPASGRKPGKSPV